MRQLIKCFVKDFISFADVLCEVGALIKLIYNRFIVYVVIITKHRLSALILQRNHCLIVQSIRHCQWFDVFNLGSTLSLVI